MKVAVLLVLVLLAMRVTSWALQWILLRHPRVGGKGAIVAGSLKAMPGIAFSVACTVRVAAF